MTPVKLQEIATSTIIQSPDPAWFYSSLAQVSAAIVGLIGAVLGSRIIEHVTHTRELRERLNQLIFNQRSSLNDRKSFFQNFKHYNQQLVTDNETLISGGQRTRSFSSFQDWGSSGSGGQQTVDASKDKLNAEKNIRDLDKLLGVTFVTIGTLEEKNITDLIFKFENTEKSLESEKGKEYTKGIITMLKQFQKEIRIFKSKLFPKSFFIVFLVLVWLSISGIIWPLNNLYALSNKNLMLVSLSIGLIGIISYFLYQLFEIYRLGKLKWEE